MDLKDCLQSKYYLDTRIEEGIKEFATYEERRSAWKLLNPREQKYWISKSLEGFSPLKDMVDDDEATRQALQDIKTAATVAMTEEWYPDPTDFIRYLSIWVNNLYKSHLSDSIIQEKVVDLLHARAMEDQKANGDEQTKLFWKYMQVPTESLISAMSDQRLQDFLFFLMKKYFSSISSKSQLIAKLNQWRDMYRRRCMRFLDPTDEKWAEFGSVGDHKRKKYMAMFQEAIMTDLLRPMSLSLPGQESEYVSKVHRKYKGNPFLPE